VQTTGWFWTLWSFLTRRRVRYIAAWGLCLVVAAILHFFAWRNFNSRSTNLDERRCDGNDGHATIDFGGQWLMGRMLTRGYGRELYNRNRQYEVAWQAFPRSAQAPAATSNDAENLLGWFVTYEHDSEYKQRLQSSLYSRTACVLPVTTFGPIQAVSAIHALQTSDWEYRDPVTRESQPVSGPHTPDAMRHVPLKQIGGPLYPPIHAMLMAPLAIGDDPLTAYRITQIIMLLMAFAGGLGVSVLTERRLWWPIATMMIMFFPGFRGSHHLGQNAALSLAIVIWGWVLMHRGREFAGGALWGLLAFKPTIALAFLLAPVLTRRWRACAGMIGVGIGLILATLPFVGVQSWLDWMKVGGTANHIYNVDDNWVFLSRDLLNAPRRFLINWDHEYNTRDRWFIQVAGWCFWLLVVETTLRIAAVRRDQVRAATGPAAGFVLLGTWASCFHFMYYDVLLAFLGFVVVFSEPRKLVEPLLLLLQRPSGSSHLLPGMASYFEPRLAQSHPQQLNQGIALPRVLTANSFLLSLYAVLMLIAHPLQWLSVTGSFVATNWFPAIAKTTKDGTGTKQAITPNTEKQTETTIGEGTSIKTVFQMETKPAEHRPMLEITTNLVGPPWDTYILLVLWAWAGAMTLRASTNSCIRPP